MMIRRYAVVAALPLLVSACAGGNTTNYENAAILANIEAEADVCRARIPARKGSWVRRFKCINEAYAPKRAIVPYPDLFDLDLANRIAVAEKLDRGLLTEAEADQQFNQERSKIVSEENRRKLGARSVQAQESAVAAANRPVTCNIFGNNAHCF